MNKKSRRCQTHLKMTTSSTPDAKIYLFWIKFSFLILTSSDISHMEIISCNHTKVYQVVSYEKSVDFNLNPIIVHFDLYPFLYLPIIVHCPLFHPIAISALLRQNEECSLALKCNQTIFHLCRFGYCFPLI